MNIPHPLEGTYVIGATGMGKSSFLASRMIADHQAGTGFTLIDPKQDLADLVYSHTDSATVLDVDSANFRVNLFACPDPRHVDMVVDRVMQVFHKVFNLSREQNPRLNQYLRNTSRLLVKHNGSMLDMPKVLMDSGFRDRLLRTADQPTRDFWSYHESLAKNEKAYRIESTYDRVDEFLGSQTATRIFGSSENTIDWTEVMDNNQTVLVRLSTRLEMLSSLVGAVLMSQIASAAIARTNRVPYSIYCDEYQRFATPATNDLLTVGRSFGIATTVAHQTRSQLDYLAKGATLQAGNIVIFRVVPPDNEELSGLFEVPEEEGRVIGRIAKQVVDPNPVGALLSSGHANPEVRSIIQNVLIPAFDYYDSKNDKFDSKRTGIRMINVFLNDIMERKYPVLSQASARAILDILFMLPFPLFGTVNSTDNVKKAIIRGVVVTVSTGIRDWSSLFEAVIAETQATQNRYFNEEYWKIVRNPRLREPFLSQHQAFREAHPYKWEEHRQEASRLVQIQEADVLAALEARRLAALAKTEREIEDNDLIRRVDYHTTVFLRLATFLLQEPVMVETDQFEEMRERPRSVADRQGEIANQLANLPVLTAKVKIRNENRYIQEDVTIEIVKPSERGGFISLPWQETLIAEQEYFYEDQPFFSYGTSVEETDDDGPPRPTA